MLERKCRENTLGWKETLAIQEPLEVRGAERGRFMAELARRCDARWRHVLLRGLEPMQWISYLREYHASADGRVRLTLDRGLRFSDQRLLARLSDTWRSFAPRVLVLEVKCAPEDLAAAREIVGRLWIPLGRCSKYVLACEPDQGPLPSFLAV